MKKEMNNQFQGTEAELNRLTEELVQLEGDHRAGYQSALTTYTEAFREQIANAAGFVNRDTTRRTFLAGGAAIGGGVLLAACGDSATSPTAAAASGLGADEKVVRLAASLEVLAVNTYTTAIGAVQAGKFGNVPAAVVKFATTAKSQHSDHLKSWNGVLTGASLSTQTDPDPALVPTVNTAIQGLTDLPSLAKLALTLEMVAVETYTYGAASVASQAGRQVALSIAPVEAQHVAILNFVLGVYPGTLDASGKALSFIPKDAARSITDLG